MSMRSIVSSASSCVLSSRLPQSAPCSLRTGEVKKANQPTSGLRLSGCGGKHVHPICDFVSFAYQGDVITGPTARGTDAAAAVSLVYHAWQRLTFRVGCWLEVVASTAASRPEYRIGADI